MDEIVLMVPKGYLVTAEFLSEIKELFTSHPGAEETGLLLTVKTLAGLIIQMVYTVERFYIEVRRSYVDPDAKFFTELLQIAGVRLVVDVIHSYVQSLDSESWMLDL